MHGCVISCTVMVHVKPFTLYVYDMVTLHWVWAISYQY